MLGQQRPRRLGPEHLKSELRQTLCLEPPHFTVARREEQHHALRLEPPCRERERVGRRPIEPLRVVDHADERHLLSGLREKSENRHADQEAVLD